ncbi:hypothetical protein [Ilyobacter polytropus]|uniref:Uncharacterized protein n=1 Tax=Ilyobacter polytropus (strain ATCC 51220 / DSM 2926 / LMG 16218 / CuHBu1) TaxID=572544 RepID=E3H8C1_ILYPC|nr:hypothetical protein [Ilyobacter polytropus]ADO82688.1 hypothetical protein Ilyop_0903 [Ilyobacter polytropus DSM 2926]
MPKIIDWNKVTILASKGFSVKEISNELEIAPGTLYNNKEKWVPADKKFSDKMAGEVVAEVVEGKTENTPLNSASTSKEVIEVKEFYKSTLRAIRDKISEIIKSGLNNEDSFYQVQLLEKLVKILKETRQIDYVAHDILTYKDLASFEIMIKKLELGANRRV